jgi:hypothetical protein
MIIFFVKSIINFGELPQIVEYSLARSHVPNLGKEAPKRTGETTGSCPIGFYQWIEISDGCRTILLRPMLKIDHPSTVVLFQSLKS